MYSTCIACHKALRSNQVLPHLSVGRRIAYDLTRGRIWVVCTRCQQWNLTPLEDRWEALEDCEAAYKRAELRVGGNDITVAQTDEGLELIRIGPNTTRSDIANWRYGKRLRRRRGLIVLAASLLGAATLVALIAINVSGGDPIGALWASAIILASLHALPESLPWRVVALHRMPDGSVASIRASDLPSVALRANGKGQHFTLSWGYDKELVRLRGSAVADVLAELLPRMNWRGGHAGHVAAALRLVENAEQEVEASTQSVGRFIWERVFRGKEHGLLTKLAVSERLALEMAVSEDVEIRSLQGAAIRLRPAWRSSERVAAIADDLLLPPFVTEWLTRHARGSEKPGAGPAA